MESCEVLTARHVADCSLSPSCVPRICARLPWNDWCIRTPGVRVWFVDVQWQLQSRLLSVRQFSPTVDVNESVLRGYLLDVLEEFQLTEKCVFSTTTEARGLVRRLAGTLVASRQEWCIANMLDTTLFEVWCCRGRGRRRVSHVCVSRGRELGCSLSILHFLLGCIVDASVRTPARLILTVVRALRTRAMVPLGSYRRMLVSNTLFSGWQGTTPRRCC